MNVPRNTAPEPRFLVPLTRVQRAVVAELVPELAERLRLAEADQKTMPFTAAELTVIREKAGTAIPHAANGTKRNSLRHVADLAATALDRFSGIGAIPVSARLYQLKVTLQNVTPPIWRRIQVKDGTLDKLHERLQTAMGWTNSHLHHFQIDGRLYGDPLLMGDNFTEMGYADSTAVKLGDIVPKAGTRFAFEYEYDFGDGWRHEMVFEGCLKPEPGRKYPVCLEGGRNCPPEDVGGTPGYAEFLDAFADPEHERHSEFLTWVGGAFDPEAFDPEAVTRRMQRGLPDWRRVGETE
jgi:hypothetical protein